MKKFNPIIEANNDGLTTQDVGPWAIEKYSLVGQYCDLFTRSVAKKWGNITYIDLFSGTGFAQLRGDGRIVYNSALIALSLNKPFSNYILCEKDNTNLDALKLRVERIFPDKVVHFFSGDSNKNIEEIIKIIPSYNLSFCFVDPFSLNLHFSTIKKLSETRVDFLILLALQMDARRNYSYYIRKENTKIEIFLGDKQWRIKFEKHGDKSNNGFMKFLGEEYKKNMISIGYKVGDSNFHMVKNDNKVPIYYLAFFSRHDLGNKFWSISKDASSNQKRLFE